MISLSEFETLYNYERQPLFSRQVDEPPDSNPRALPLDYKYLIKKQKNKQTTLTLNLTNKFFLDLSDQKLT